MPDYRLTVTDAETGETYDLPMLPPGDAFPYTVVVDPRPLTGATEDAATEDPTEQEDAPA